MIDDARANSDARLTRYELRGDRQTLVADFYNATARDDVAALLAGRHASLDALRRVEGALQAVAAGHVAPDGATVHAALADLRAMLGPQ